MKKLKLSLTGIACLLILAGVIAFKPLRTKTNLEPKKQKAAVIGQWYIYIGTSPGSSFALDPSNYRPLSGAENVNVLCNGYQTLCAIYAEPDPMMPGSPLITISQPIWSRIVEYYNYGIANPNYIKRKNL